MRRILVLMLFCLFPGLSFAQSPSITVTPPRIETSHAMTLKQVAVVVAAVAVGAIAGQWVIGNTVGTWIGAAAGGVSGLWLYDEYAEEIDDL